MYTVTLRINVDTKQSGQAIYRKKTGNLQTSPEKITLIRTKM